MSVNILPSSQAPIVGTINPGNSAAATYTTAWVSMSDFANIMAIIALGSLGTSATIDAKLQQATDSSGTGAKDVTGKAITQFTQAGSDDGKQAIINCSDNELDIANNFNHVRLSLTIGTAACDVGAIVLGFQARYEPEADLSTVDEIVS